MNHWKTDLAKVFKPRSRAGRKPKVVVPNTIPDVGNEIEVVDTVDDPILPEAGCSRPKRAASNAHAGLGRLISISPPFLKFILSIWFIFRLFQLLKLLPKH